MDKNEENKVNPAEVNNGTEAVPTATLNVTAAGVQASGPENSPAGMETLAYSPQENPLNKFKDRVNEEINMQDKPRKKNYMWPILLIFIIAILLLAGVFAYKKGFLGIEKINIISSSPTPTPTVAPSSTPTPSVAVDLSEYEIEILNGSEVDGEASRQKDNLEGEGFTISSIGNADDSDYTDTIIEAKKDVDKNFIAKLKDALSNTFTVGEVQALSEDSSASVIVTLGTKK